MTREEILNAVTTEPQSARDVADQVGCSRTTAAGVLHGADADGVIAAKRIDRRRWVFWRSDE